MGSSTEAIPRFVSTRGQQGEFSFVEATLQGLASDGGLLVPTFIPPVTHQEMELWQECSYTELCYRVMQKFIDPTEIPSSDLKSLIETTYTRDKFLVKDCIGLQPLKAVAFPALVYIAELYHGPTFAFKDFGLQFLGNLLEYILNKRSEKAIVLGATSGDTGSAAIHAFRGLKTIQCVIVYPHQRISRIQELQMTQVRDSNIHTVALEGATFDDCQSLVKQIFRSDAKQTYRLTSANSLNFARLLAQIVYYWFISLKLLKLTQKSVVICVPTGNFGNILAAHYARCMGARIQDLVIATNSNDILARFYKTGEYKVQTVHPTMSPSMDIQISSNLERFIYELVGTEQTRQYFGNDLPKQGFIRVSPQTHKQFQTCFRAFTASESETASTILAIFNTEKRLIDPHTAVGVHSALEYAKERKPEPIVVISTAHYAKFYDAMTQIIPESVLRANMPGSLRDMVELEVSSPAYPSSEGSILSAIKKAHENLSR